MRFTLNIADLMANGNLLIIFKREHKISLNLSKTDKGEWRVDERTTFMEYLCNETSYGGSEGSSGIFNGMLFSWHLFLSVKKIVKTNKHSSK